MLLVLPQNPESLPATRGARRTCLGVLHRDGDWFDVSAGPLLSVLRLSWAVGNMNRTGATVNRGDGGSPYWYSTSLQARVGVDHNGADHSGRHVSGGP